MTTILRVYRADWAPHIEQVARAIATAAAFVYVCGYVSGRWLHRLNDRLSALLVRQRGLKLQLIKEQRKQHKVARMVERDSGFKKQKLNLDLEETLQILQHNYKHKIIHKQFKDNNSNLEI